MSKGLVGGNLARMMTEAFCGWSGERRIGGQVKVGGGGGSSQERHAHKSERSPACVPCSSG